jgi:hypothetical protein
MDEDFSVKYPPSAVCSRVMMQDKRQFKRLDLEGMDGNAGCCTPRRRTFSI